MKIRIYKIVLILIGIGSLNSVFGQNRVAYYDAKMLAALYRSKQALPVPTKIPLTNADILNNLKYYFKPGADITAEVAANPFLKSYFSVGGQASLSLAETGGLISGLTAGVGSINVTAFADSLAKFLISRAKQEIMMSFFDRLNDTTKFPEFKILFPNTQVVVANFNSWEYANAVNTLREAFDKDFKQLLVDIPNLNTLDSTKYKNGVKTRVHAITVFLSSPNGRIIISAMQIGNGFITGAKIPDVIHIIAGGKYLYNMPGSTPDVNNVISLLDVLSYSLRNSASGKSYISLSDLTDLFKDPIARELYLGLVYQKLQSGWQPGGNIALPNIIATADTARIHTYITEIINQSGDINDAVVKLNAAKKKGEKDLTTYWSAIFESGNQFFQSLGDISTVDPSLALPDKVQKAIDLSSNTLEIAHDISIRNYNAALVGALTLISKNVDKKDGDISASMQFFVKYGSFGANIVLAKNSGEVEKAIEAVALPAGSYSIKQKSAFNISLNGYIGYGWDMDGVFSKPYAHGVYTPVGFSFSRGSLKHKYGFPVSVFLSVIDIGSFVSYNLTDNSKNTNTLKQDIRLESIFSPSAQFFIEVPTTPIALGIGWRLTPKLFYSNDAGFVTVQPRSVFNASILIDIPIFNLHNTPFK